MEPLDRVLDVAVPANSRVFLRAFKVTGTLPRPESWRLAASALKRSSASPNSSHSMSQPNSSVTRSSMKFIIKSSMSLPPKLESPPTPKTSRLFFETRKIVTSKVPPPKS